MIGVAILAAIHELNVRWPSLFSRQNKDPRVDDNLLKPTRVEWDKLADRFSKYDGELEVMWEFYERYGRTEFNIPREGNNAMMSREFVADAKRAGLMAKAMGPRKTHYKRAPL